MAFADYGVFRLPSVNAEKQIDDERVLSEFEQLEVRVTNAVNDAEASSNAAQTYAILAESHKNNAQLYNSGAKASADSAKDFCNSAEIYASDAENAEGRIASQISAFEESYGNASEQVQKANAHYTDKNNPHGVTASQIGAADADHTHIGLEQHLSDTENPHKVTAGQTGAYTKEETDGLINQVWESDDFAWTDFEYFADGAEGVIADIKDNEIQIGYTDPGEFVEIVCRNNILGFTFSISGYNNARMRINGENRVYTNSTKDGGVFATDTIPLTYLTGDIFLYGGNNTWEFTDMVQQKAKGIPGLEAQIGDIDEALDGIIAVQNGLIDA